MIRLGCLLPGTGLGCSDDTSPDERATTGEPYAVLEADGWTLQETVDPRPDDRIASIARPRFDWYAEYVRGSSTESQMVLVSGHSVGFDEVESAVETLGFVADDVEVHGWRALAFVSDDPEGPAVIALANGATSFLVTSYELEPDGLAAVAGTVAAVYMEAWIEAGGVVR